MVRKSRLRLVLAGFAFLAAAGLAWFIPYLRVPGTIAGLVGLYLLAWATPGGGYWCRNCKRFNIH